jgi:hypothetical protein
VTAFPVGGTAEKGTVKFFVQGPDMAGQECDGGLGLVADTGTKAAGVETVAEAIGGPAGLLDDPALLVHERLMGMGDHEVPGEELRSR